MSLQFLDLPGDPPAAAQDLQGVMNTAPGFGFTTSFMQIERDSVCLLLTDPGFPVKVSLLAGGIVPEVPGVKNTVYSAGNIGYTDLATGFGTNVTFETPTSANALQFPDSGGSILASRAENASVDNTVDTTINVRFNGIDYYLLARTTP